MKCNTGLDNIAACTSMDCCDYSESVNSSSLEISNQINADALMKIKDLKNLVNARENERDAAVVESGLPTCRNEVIQLKDRMMALSEINMALSKTITILTQKRIHVLDEQVDNTLELEKTTLKVLEDKEDVNEDIQLKDENMALSETIAMLGHKNVHDGTSSVAVPVRVIVDIDIGMEIEKMKENNHRHQRLVLKKLLVEKHASTIDFFRQKRFDPCRSISLVEKIDDITKHVVPLVSSKMLCEEFNLFEKLLLENEEKEDVNQDRNQRVLVAGQETKVKRRNLVACPTFLFADDKALEGTGGYNVLTESCVMGDQFSYDSAAVDNKCTHCKNNGGIPYGKTLKIKKDPSVVGEIVLDRQATSANKGRHFEVEGTIVMEGITLTGGYEVSCISSNILLLII